jgi:type I restriction enzyme S subunit
LDELVKSRFVELFGDVKTNKFGWEKCRFGDVATKITDGEHGTVPRVEKGESYLYFMARNITKDGNIDLTETSYVPEEVHRKIYKRCNPETGDILLVCVGATIGKCTIVSKDFEEFSMARSVALIKPARQKVNSTFLISLLKSDAIQNDISNCAHTAAQAGLYTNMIINLDAFLPPIELQNQFAAFVEQTDKSKFEIQKSLEKLETLKKSLMQKYFG